jgi:broad specificity phosphatase PhoE
VGASEIAKIEGAGWRGRRGDRVFSGPEQRTRQTAAALGISAEVSRQLRDCDYGAWSGCSLGQIQLENPAEVAAWLSDPDAAPYGGESVVQLIERTALWMEVQREAGGHTIAVTHPAVIRSALVHGLQAAASMFWRFDIPPLSVTDVRWNGKVWTVRSTGCALENAGPQA